MRLTEEDKQAIKNAAYELADKDESDGRGFDIDRWVRAFEDRLIECAERAVVEKWAKRLEGVVQNAMTGSYIAAEMRASLEEKADGE